VLFAAWAFVDCGNIPKQIGEPIPLPGNKQLKSESPTLDRDE